MTRFKLIAGAAVATAAIGVPLAVAATDGGQGDVTVVAPENASPATIAPEPQPGAATPEAKSAPAGQPAVPAPTTPPPSVDGAPVDIGDPVDPAAPPQSDVPLPLPGEGMTAREAQYNAKPVDDAGSPTGIAFATRYYGVYSAGGTDFKVTVQQPSTRARSVGLTLGNATERLADGTTAYSGPGDNTSFLHGGVIVIVSGGTDAQRLAFAGGLKYTA